MYKMQAFSTFSLNWIESIYLKCISFSDKVNKTSRNILVQNLCELVEANKSYSTFYGNIYVSKYAKLSARPNFLQLYMYKTEYHPLFCYLQSVLLT